MTQLNYKIEFNFNNTSQNESHKGINWVPSIRATQEFVQSNILEFSLTIMIPIDNPDFQS